MGSTSKTARRALTAAAVVASLLVAVPAAMSAPSEDTLAKAVAAAERGQSTARDMAQGPKDETKATGLDRAAAALAAVAEKRAARAGAEKPGRALGVGRADAVHEALAAGGSPSELASHGETVSGLAKAYQELKGADKPGRGHGAGGNPDDNDDVGDED